MEKSIFHIVQTVKDQFKPDLYGDHGIFHWEQVEKIGLYLAKHYPDVDLEVISLFAYLHDSKVENDNHDPEHGKRAAEFITKIYSQKILKISQPQYTELEFACRYHSNPAKISDSVTVQVCWDSDRLDLWRVGEIPNPQYLNTQIAKQKDTIEWALHFVYDYYQANPANRPYMPPEVKEFEQINMTKRFLE